jgi:hypothetical protein
VTASDRLLLGQGAAVGEQSSKCRAVMGGGNGHMRMFHWHLADVSCRCPCVGSEFAKIADAENRKISGLSKCFQSYSMDMRGVADVQLLFKWPSYLVLPYS